MQIETIPTINILLVEDNADHAELIRRSLKNGKVNNHIYHMENGEEAWDYLIHKSTEDSWTSPIPHLIILDIRLPRMSGIDFLYLVKHEERFKEIPVIMLSTSRSDEDIRQSYQNHANSYLIKPTGFDRFSNLIADLGHYWFMRNQLPR